MVVLLKLFFKGLPCLKSWIFLLKICFELISVQNHSFFLIFLNLFSVQNRGFLLKILFRIFFIVFLLFSTNFGQNFWDFLLKIYFEGLPTKNVGLTLQKACYGLPSQTRKWKIFKKTFFKNRKSLTKFLRTSQKISIKFGYIF